MQTRYKIVARIVKPFAKQGEVVIEGCDGLPSLISEGMKIWMLPPLSKRPPAYTVVSAEDPFEPTQKIALKEVDSLSKAEELVGRFVLAETEQLEPLQAHLPQHLLGQEVIAATSGKTYLIEAVLTGVVHDVWLLHGEEGFALVPAHPDFIEDFPESGPIVLHIPNKTEWFAERSDLGAL